jgi:hypothetical protein
VLTIAHSGNGIERTVTLLDPRVSNKQIEEYSIHFQVGELLEVRRRARPARRVEKPVGRACATLNLSHLHQGLNGPG